MLRELFPLCLRSFSPLLESSSGKNYLLDSFLIPLIVCIKESIGEHCWPLSIVSVASVEVGIDAC